MSRLSQQRYLSILETGAFANFPSEQLAQLHKEVGNFLIGNSGQLELADQFDLYELQFYLSLLTNHDVEAKSYLDRVNDQFSGKRSQKIMILRLMYYEATGDMKLAVKALGENADELRASRRLATFSKHKMDGSLNVPEYIKNLNFYLNLQPADAVAWAELGDQYHAIGHYDKAVFCFKEVLLQQPHAYNIFYKAGINYYYQFLQEQTDKNERKDRLLASFDLLQNARDCFLRSVEISENYVKGWVGVYVVSKLPFIEKLEGNKTLSGNKKVALFILETKKLQKLSQNRVIAIEQLESVQEFEAYLEGRF